MDVSAFTLGVVCVSVFISGLVHGTVGFGAGLIAVGLMGSVLGMRDASFTVSVPALIMTGLMAWRLRRHVVFLRHIPLLLASFVGLWFGLRFLLTAHIRLIEVAGGLLMLATALYVSVPHWAKTRWHPVYMGVPCGLLGGLLSGAYSSGGPPIVAFMATQNYDRLRYVASLQILFAIISIARLSQLVAHRVLTSSHLVHGAAATVCMIAGSWCGVGVLKRLSDRVVKTLVILLLGALGVMYLLK